MNKGLWQHLKHNDKLVYHLAGSLLTPEGENPKFLQIYFVGNSEQVVKESTSASTA